jgi:tetratricopeptide (TPR) repeat protein
VRRFALIALALVCLPFAQAADPSPALQDAAATLQRGDYAGAELKLRAELKLHPDDGDTLSLLGVALDSQRKFPEADAVHRRAIATDPRSARVLGKYGNHLLNTGDEKGAREIFQKAIGLQPADRYSNLQLAQLALRSKDAGHAKEALGYLDHLPAAQRDAPEVAVQRLVALDLSGNRQEAEAVFTRLFAAIQNDANISASAGWALAEAGQFERSETLLTRALAADASNFHVLYDLGVVAIYARHYERARDVLEKAVRQQPDNADALYSLAFSYSALGQPEPTLRVAAQAARVAPQRADVQRLIAVTAGELQANEDSAAAWDRYAALAPNDDSARRERGFARIHLRQFETGIADLEWYIARHPDDPVGHYELGLAQSTSDPTKGLASLDKALELKPDFVAARSARGALNYLQGKPEAAVPDLEAAAASEPTNGMILDRLGQAYRALDRLKDAIRTLRKAAELAPKEATIKLHLGNALAEAGEDAESEALMDRYRQLRPTQAPKDLMHYLSLTPEQQRADYRARVEKAVHDNPGDANAQLHYLKLELEEGQMDQASATARTIVALKPGAALLADAGRAELEARQYSAAAQLLGKAAATDPSAGLELDLANAAFHTAGAAEGLRLMDRVTPARRNADYYFARAQMLDESGKSADAFAAMEQAIKGSPRRADLYWQAAVLLSRNRRGTEALQLLDRAAQTLPQDPQIPLVKATLLERAGQTADAERLLDTIQHRWPEGSAVWVARGIIQAAHEHFDEARRALETAVALGARSPEALFCLADAIVRSAPDRMDDAEAAVATALRLAPEDSWLAELAGRIAFRKGDYKSAVARQEIAVRLRPRWAEPHRDLAQAYEAVGRKSEAESERKIAGAILKESPGRAAESPDPGRLFYTSPPQDW